MVCIFFLGQQIDFCFFLHLISTLEALLSFNKPFNKVLSVDFFSLSRISLSAQNCIHSILRRDSRHCRGMKIQSWSLQRGWFGSAVTWIFDLLVILVINNIDVFPIRGKPIDPTVGQFA